ncbi:hypothetical protein KR018_003827 [Drosophila ironensis]|nr:hypothetical protein KR018_003827 [Drosophila ironensis]
MERGSLAGPEKFSNRDIAQKVHRGEYRLFRKEERSTVWRVFREILRSDGTKVSGYCYCDGCNRVMRSLNTSNLRIHKCHVEYLRRKQGKPEKLSAASEVDAPPSEIGEEMPNESPIQVMWSPSAVRLLLQLWAENQEELLASRKFSHVVRRIASEMSHFGVTDSDVKNEMFNLKEKYLQEAQQERLTGEPSAWEDFPKVQAILKGTSSKRKAFIPVIYGDEKLGKNNKIQGNREPTEAELSDNELAEEEEDDLEVLKDNLINDIEASNNGYSLENYEDELDKQDERAQRKISARMLEIEEEKLVLEREKLNIEREKIKILRSILNEVTTNQKGIFKLLSLGK